MRLYQRSMCYGSVLTSVLWIVVILLYWRLQDSKSSKQDASLINRNENDIRARFDNTPFSKALRHIHAHFTQPNLQELAVIRQPQDQQLRDYGYKKFAFNELVSVRLGFNRSIPDVRNELCGEVNYPEKLPSASVIICFYNEAWSVLLRSIYSVINRSPSNLHEVLLVDDSSDMPHLGSQLEDFIAANLSPKVRLLRTNQREGLIRARIFGADHATGDVLVFLDSHCEVNKDWLEPLLAHIALDRHNVAIPIIDIINQDTFMYEASPLVRGGFNWGMFYRWDRIPESELSSKDRLVKPIKTPTMAGGLFAIERQYFVELGKYDPGLDTWGGENLELSFRVWQCGGRMDIIPCSRVGHVFRNRRPYGNIGGADSLIQNSLRVAHVWLDEYIEYYFRIRPEARNISFGDISSRIELRRKLNCKPFRWYLANVYPEQTLPDESYAAGVRMSKQLGGNGILNKKPKVIRKGWLRHLQLERCIVAEQDIYEKNSLVKLDYCDTNDRTQVWHELEESVFQLSGILCLDIDIYHKGISFARIAKCHFASGGQEWKWMKVARNSRNRLLNPASGRCLSAGRVGDQFHLTLELCSDEDPLQNFEMMMS